MYRSLIYQILPYVSFLKTHVPLFRVIWCLENVEIIVLQIPNVNVSITSKFHKTEGLNFWDLTLQFLEMEVSTKNCADQKKSGIWHFNCLHIVGIEKPSKNVRKDCNLDLKNICTGIVGHHKLKILRIKNANSWLKCSSAKWRNANIR